MKQFQLGVLAAMTCLIVGAGCNGPTAPPAPVVEADGDIKYDGEPVMAGIISFVPADSDPRASSGGAIRDGKYRVYPEANLKPGKYRVEIRWSKATGEKREAGYGQSPDVYAEVLPEKYHSQSVLTAELQPGQNHVDFILEK